MAMKSSDVIMRLINEEGDSRDVRWSEFVTMVLKDSCLDSYARWRSLIIDDLPPMSSDVDEQESRVSDERLDDVVSASLIAHPIIHILLLPLMEKFMRAFHATLHDQGIEVSQSLMMDYISDAGPVLHDAMLSSVMSSISVLNDLGFLDVRDHDSAEMFDIDYDSIEDFFLEATDLGYEGDDE